MRRDISFGNARALQKDVQSETFVSVQITSPESAPILKTICQQLILLLVGSPGAATRLFLGAKSDP